MANLKASDNPFPSILIEEGTEPAAPAAGHQRIYIDSTTHVPMIVNSSGAETPIGSSVADILDLPTAETDDTLVLAPDGAGGVEFRAETGGGYPTLTVADVIRTTDVSCGGSAYTDVVSLALSSGTWDIYAIANIVNSGSSNNTCFAAITDNSNTQIAQVQVGFVANAMVQAAPVIAPGVAGSQTIKLRVYATATCVATGSTNVGTGGGSRIHAVRVA